VPSFDHELLVELFLMELCCDVVLSALPATIREALEAKMQGYKYKSEFALRYYGQGEAAGLEKGRQALQTAALSLARHKLERVTDDEQHAIEAVCDPNALTELITALGTAATAAEARAAIARATERQPR
jgi:hypothetical protein